MIVSGLFFIGHFVLLVYIYTKKKNQHCKFLLKISIYIINKNILISAGLGEVSTLEIALNMSYNQLSLWLC